MRQKTLKELDHQWRRIGYDALKRHWNLSKHLNNTMERYADNMKEYCGKPRGWRTCKTKDIEDVKVPFEIYTK